MISAPKASRTARNELLKIDGINAVDDDVCVSDFFD
jgi:hypothetical protein